jgi:hypothetical protein
LLAACSFWETTETPTPEPLEEEQETSTAPVEVRETQNVTYTGIIKPAGISVYQQGTHRLVLSDDRFVLLESDTVDLNGYVDEEVEVFGAVRPTVEEGGMIMRVENIHLLEEENVSSAAATGTVVVPEPESETSKPSVAAPSSQKPAPVVPEKPVVEEEEEEEAAASLTVQQEAAVKAMASDTYSDDRWTQKYCTGHIGFCFPVHKNWWFQSFGNTTSHLWHVELNNAAITNIGDGVIVVKLVQSSVASAGAADGQVLVQGSTVTGYRAWEGDTHFEIVADARLKTAVEYITGHLVKYSE